VWTLVELDAISSGFTDGIEDTANHRITPGYAGFYGVFGSVTFASVVAAKTYIAAIRINGNTYKTGNYQHSGLVYYVTANVSDILKLTATDYVELVCQSRAGVDTVDVRANEIYTFLSVQRVR